LRVLVTHEHRITWEPARGDPPARWSANSRRVSWTMWANPVDSARRKVRPMFGDPVCTRSSTGENGEYGGGPASTCTCKGVCTTNELINPEHPRWWCEKGFWSTGRDGSTPATPSRSRDPSNYLLFPIAAPVAEGRRHDRILPHRFRPARGAVRHPPDAILKQTRGARPDGPRMWSVRRPPQRRPRVTLLETGPSRWTYDSQLPLG